MLNVDTGVQGAKRQSWQKPNPRELLRRLIEEREGATETQLLRSFMTTALTDPDMIETIIEYWFANNFRSLMAAARTVDPIEVATRSQQKQAAVSDVKVKVRHAIVREAKIMLLDLVQPNGKKLSDCTGAECSKFGGWLSAVGACVKANQKVGTKLSEVQLQELFIRA